MQTGLTVQEIVDFSYKLNRILSLLCYYQILLETSLTDLNLNSRGRSSEICSRIFPKRVVSTTLTQRTEFSVTLSYLMNKENCV